MTEKVSECRGFRWVGQSMSHCDECGRDLVDHDGLSRPVRDAGPFEDVREEIVSFQEAERRIPLFALQVVPLDGSSVRRYHESQRGASCGRIDAELKADADAYRRRARAARLRQNHE